MMLQVRILVIPIQGIMIKRAQVSLLGNILYLDMSGGYIGIYLLYGKSLRYICDLYTSLNIQIFFQHKVKSAAWELLIHWFNCFLFVLHMKKHKKFPAENNDQRIWKQFDLTFW